MTGKKFDDGKLPMSLLPFASLEEISKVLAYGAKNMHLIIGRLFLMQSEDMKMLYSVTSVLIRKEKHTTKNQV